jgi:hypothetical protein
MIRIPLSFNLSWQPTHKTAANQPFNPAQFGKKSLGRLSLAQ